MSLAWREESDPVREGRRVAGSVAPSSDSLISGFQTEQSKRKGCQNVGSCQTPRAGVPSMLPTPHFSLPKEIYYWLSRAMDATSYLKKKRRRLQKGAPSCAGLGSSSNLLVWLQRPISFWNIGGGYEPSCTLQQEEHYLNYFSASPPLCGTPDCFLPTAFT